MVPGHAHLVWITVMCWTSQLWLIRDFQGLWWRYLNVRYYDVYFARAFVVRPLLVVIFTGCGQARSNFSPSLCSSLKPSDTLQREHASNFLQLAQHLHPQLLIDLQPKKGPLPSWHRSHAGSFSPPKSWIMMAFTSRLSYGSLSNKLCPDLTQNDAPPNADLVVLFRNRLRR